MTKNEAQRRTIAVLEQESSTIVGKVLQKIAKASSEGKFQVVLDISDRAMPVLISGLDNEYDVTVAPTSLGYSTVRIAWLR